MALFDLTPAPIGLASTAALWTRHGPALYQAERVGEISSFYPVYQMGDLYSFSILPLLAKKGRLDVNEAYFAQPFTGPGSPAGAHQTVDREIRRLGAPPALTRGIKTRSEAIEKLAHAMQADIAQTCADNPGTTQFVLCGGRDSLNILLADWPAHVIALSAQPNTPLVAEFVAQNGLDIEVRELRDPQPDTLDREIAEAACLNDLEHWKWTEHLRQIAREVDHKAIFWKGQMADAFLTDFWKGYTNNPNKAYQTVRKVYKRLSRKVPALTDPLFLNHTLADFRSTIWERGAVGQGGHVGMLRSICGSLVLSAYHGPQAAAVLFDLDYPAVTQSDLRPEIGAALLGRAVQYPTQNPAPPNSSFREGLRSLERFQSALGALGIAP